MPTPTTDSTHLASIVFSRVALVVDTDIREPRRREADGTAMELLKPGPQRQPQYFLSAPGPSTHLLFFMPYPTTVTLSGHRPVTSLNRAMEKTRFS